MMEDSHNLRAPEEFKSIMVRLEIEARKDPRNAKVFYDFWFERNFRDLLDKEFSDADDYQRSLQKRVEQHRQTKAKAAQLAAKLKTVVEERAQIMLLDWTLPNGKLLRDCTGKECGQMSRKIAPWLAKVAAKVKPNEIVGEVLQEAEVRRLYDSRK